MDIHTFTENVLKRFQLDPLDFIPLFLKNATLKEFKEKEFISYQGEKQKYFYLMTKGCYRMFLNDFNGNEVNVLFGKEGDFLGDLRAVTAGIEALHSLQVLEDSTVIQFDYEGLREEFKENLWWQKLQNAYYKTLYLKQEERKRQLLTFKPEERVKEVKKSEPWLWEKIPQKELASYLGITPVSLSRINQRLKKNSTN